MLRWPKLVLQRIMRPVDRSRVKLVFTAMVHVSIASRMILGYYCFSGLYREGRS